MQADHIGQDPTEIAYPPATVYTAAISHTDPLSPLVAQNADFTIGAYNYMVMMAKADSLESSMASLGQTRDIINIMDDLASTRTYPLNAQGFSSPIENELDVLAAKKWCDLKRHEQTVNWEGAEELAVAAQDWPRDPAAQKAKAEELCQLALNEVEIVDNIWHGSANNQKVNPIIKKKRGMSALTLAIFGWDALFAVRDCQIGAPKIPMFATGYVYRMYESFQARMADVEELFRTSKAAVVNHLAAPPLLKSVAQPYRAIKTKQTNQKNNNERKETIRAAKDLMANANEDDERSDFDPDSDDEERSTDGEGEDEPAVSEDLSAMHIDNGNENIDDQEMHDQANEPPLNQADDNNNLDDNTKRDLVVQWMVTQGVEQPPDEDMNGKTAYMEHVQLLMGDDDFVEALQADAHAAIANGGGDGENI
ncbi:hypothetical protein B0T20DRAFT_451916 [Sordaria brevicollis]|uniref:Uncharacterized protein n=1 Tax=Sordaria brevicollis TaxID=83679 RepID=A0AAE0PGU1_SORBR|nr:hypothetical protein B0T20DRAFT_451916 [Sordaria brevicollis]